MLPNLAVQADATAYGYGTIASAMFARASARVRGYTRQVITAQTSTTTARGPIIQLPQRPVNAITSVTEVSDPANTYTLLVGDWTLRSGSILETPHFGGNLTVVYTSGWAVLPDELIELVCGVAARLSNTLPAIALGAQQETGGSESVTYGFDSYNAVSELSSGEKAILDRLFPKRAGVAVLRP